MADTVDAGLTAEKIDDWYVDDCSGTIESTQSNGADEIDKSTGEPFAPSAWLDRYVLTLTISRIAIGVSSFESEEAAPGTAATIPTVYAGPAKAISFGGMFESLGDIPVSIQSDRIVCEDRKTGTVKQVRTYQVFGPWEKRAETGGT